MVISAAKNNDDNDDENAEEKKMRPEQTQSLSEYSSGFTDTYAVDAALVRTMLFPVQAPTLSMTALTGVNVEGWE